MRIKLGFEAAPVDHGTAISIDLETLLRTRMLIQASSGGGKSWLLRRLAEQLVPHVPVIIIDPEGEFATLRERFNFVLVGQGGETPADVRSAALVAHRLLELRASAVCDIYELKAHEKHRWVKAFLSALIDAPKKLWRPCVVIVDEAHLFMPEGGKGSSEASEAMIDLATRGRKRGFCSIFATQRLAKLNKDGTAELKNRLIGPTSEGIDLERAADELSIPRRERDDWFRVMRRERDEGVFEAVGPVFGRERLLIKIGNVTTSHPKVGSKFTGPPPAPSAMKKLLPQLADLPKEAEDKAATEGELRRRIRELEIEVKNKPDTTILSGPTFKIERQPKLKIVPVPVINERLVKRYEKVGARADVIAKKLVGAYGEVYDAINELKARVAGQLQAAATTPIMQPTVGHRDQKVIVKAAPLQVRQPTIEAREQAIASTTVTGPQQKLLDSLAWWASIGVEQPTKVQVAAGAGISASTGTFATYKGSLRTAGLIDYPSSNLISLTDQGRALARAPKTAPTLAELHDKVCGVLGGPHAKMLRELIKVYPDSLSKDAIGEALGISPLTGTFATYKGRLHTLGFITYPSSGHLRAADILFPEGLS